VFFYPIAHWVKRALPILFIASVLLITGQTKGEIYKSSMKNIFAGA
jgi:hypothetical protein